MPLRNRAVCGIAAALLVCTAALLGWDAAPATAAGRAEGGPKPTGQDTASQIAGGPRDVPGAVARRDTGGPRDQPGAVARRDTGGPRDVPRAPAGQPVPFERAEGRRAWSFPRDHGQHPRFRLEWWYYTGIVRTPQGRAFGYQVTFFRQGLHAGSVPGASAWRTGSVYLAHLALSDLERGTFTYSARTGRDSLGMSGAAPDRLHVWLNGWSVAPVDDSASGTSGAFRLAAQDPALGLSLTLVPERPPLLHGSGGLDRKGSAPGEASWYYSLPRLQTAGVIRLGAESWQVSGTSWMDHEFGTGQLAADQIGWDWLSLRLDNGMDLMLYRLRTRNGGASPTSGGTLREAAGRVWHVRLTERPDVRPLERPPERLTERQDEHLPERLAERPIERPRAGEVLATAVPTETWTSPKSGARYPLFWSVSLPQAGLTLTVRPAALDQELAPGAGLPFGYWEGAVWARGEWVRGGRAGRPLKGEGYLELTGYAGDLGSSFR